MSREIKFRAWDTRDKKFHYRAEHAYDCGAYYDVHIDVSCFGEILDDERYIVEQCTGLKNKIGKEIYEGDIIQIRNEYAPIVFDETRGSFMGHFVVVREGKKIEYNDYIFDFCPEDIMIVGNIHENPELLGGEE